MSLAPRSDERPNCSRRALASSSFRRSISSRALDTSASAWHGPCLGREPRRPLGEDHRMRRGEVVGQEIGAVHIDKSST